MPLIVIDEVKLGEERFLCVRKVVITSLCKVIRFDKVFQLNSEITIIVIFWYLLLNKCCTAVVNSSRNHLEQQPQISESFRVGGLFGGKERSRG